MLRGFFGNLIFAIIAWIVLTACNFYVTMGGGGVEGESTPICKGEGYSWENWNWTPKGDL